jgi:2-succinyl-6-hydroxy-2,4-cyclohexadiene-1-carboxylate synthase
MPELQSSDGRPSIWFETRGDRSGDPVVLLHGFTGTHRTWDELAERLAAKHFLILPDLPGHGRSGVSPSRAKMGMVPTSDAVAEVMGLAMGVKGSGRKAALVGYSLGGRVALELACRHQELLSCLILEGASPGIRGDVEREERRAGDDSLADEIERRGIGWFVDHWQETPLFATQKELRPPAFEVVRRDRLSNSARGLAMSLRGAGTGEMVPLWDHIGDLRMPVLVVVGKRDPKYAKIAEAMHRMIPGSVVAEVDGAGHCVHVEKPEEFAEIVRRFLSDRSEMIRAAEE